MISLNLWNSFTEETRVDIANIIYGCDILNTACYRDLAYEFRHRLTHAGGQLVKDTLSHLNLLPNGTINILIKYTPKYVNESRPERKPEPTVEEQENALRHFRVRYLDERGDLTNVHLYAENAAEAEIEAKNEYWDIESIIEITEIK